MIYCGITGHTGNLGKKIQKVAKNFKFIKFKGDIRIVKDVEAWIKNNNFDLIIHFAAIVPISKVNKKYKHALDVNYIGTRNLIKMIVKHKLKGIGTMKDELFGIFRRGGFSSSISFKDHFFEEINIRLDNKQNKILVLIIFIYKFLKNLNKF